MTITIGLPQYEIVPGTRLKRLTADFRCYSDTIKHWVIIRKGFVCDDESTPWRGENPMAGLIHDWASRKDSIDVSKIVAAKMYLEFQCYEDSLVKRPWYSKAWDCLWRGLKAGTVAIVPDFVYWHKYSVFSTAEDML